MVKDFFSNTRMLWKILHLFKETLLYADNSVYKVKLTQLRICGLGVLVVSALDFQAGHREFESRTGQDKFQTTSTPSSYSTCHGLSIKWTGRRLVTDRGTKCAWVIHESKAVQIHVHNNRRCLYVPRVPSSVKNPYNNNNFESLIFVIFYDCKRFF